MEQGKILLVAGCEPRLKAAAARLVEYADVFCAEEGTLCTPADALLLPMPAARREIVLAPLLAQVRHGGFVFAGLFTDAERAEIQRAGLLPCDYARQERFAVRNAVPTAEGAIQLAMENLPVTLHGLPVVVLGMGRLARALVPRLLALGARVAVIARRGEARAEAESFGARAFGFGRMGDIIGSVRLIVNTVPARILGMQELAKISPDALLLDISSAPYGAGSGYNR